MRRRLLSIVLVLFTAANASAAWDRSIDPTSKGDPERIGRSRHYILTPADVLSPADQAGLAMRGIEVTQPLSGGRYLVRVAPGVTVDASYERLTAEKKIHRGALRAATSGRPFASVNVLFHDDVPFEAARSVITEAGGTFEDPLQLGFEVPMRIGARIPSTALLALAADERVLLVYGPMRLRPVLHNAFSGRVSGVDVLHQAPYGLTGAGVVLSFFELYPADATHREFAGRLTTHLTPCPGHSSAAHSTHVAGTMIAAGIEPKAKGMAPAATLHQFSVCEDNFLNIKEKLSRDYGVVADNNSWGYSVGWCNSGPDCDGWVWEDTNVYYGAYDRFYTAPLDKITRTAGVLFVHSAGNDALKRGPTSAPFAHKHTDHNGDLIPGTFCYSADGSRNDCPTPACSAGTEFCEAVRHPQIVADLPAPYGSIGLTASAKNVIAVGALSVSVANPGTRVIASFSSHGPTRDGRVKPDLMARGTSVFSTTPNERYGNNDGTSMAAPAVVGMAALVTEQWRITYGGQTPSPAVLKTVLIAGAEDEGNPGPDYVYGFGTANAKNAVDLVLADGGTGRRVRSGALAHGGTFEVPLTAAAGQTVRVVLGWSDPEVVIFPSDGLATATLVNDLDLKVITPGGETLLPYVLDRSQPTQPATRGVNTIDNTEVLEFTAAAAGQYRVVVTGTRIMAQSPQQFVVVASADMQADPAPCIDFNEPNDTEATAAALARGVSVAGRTCTAADVDYFTFVANQPGEVSVTVTATGTPLRVTLGSTATGSQTAEVAAGQSGTLSVAYNSTATTPFFLRLEAAGALGTDTAYTILADYPFDPGPRRRAVGR
ncbi:MAG TPA: S8 family serine peptidase [Thermoanaerobaculia bacterium]|nr:S8 family serine peptidase [Thermoanaerobaculia bacterium]